MTDDAIDPRLAPTAPLRTRARLVVENLACRRGERVLFRDFALDVRDGDLVWLCAANGFGKTTLLRVLSGLGKPEDGRIAWTDADGGPPPLLYLAHANALKDDLTVTESVRHLARLHGLDATDAAMAAAIDRFGLRARRNAPIRTLSQGQRRRVALTRLCLSDARATWLLDEPYDALDADGIALVGELLDRHAAGGGAALFTSHLPPAAGTPGLRTVRLDATA